MGGRGYFYVSGVKKDTLFEVELASDKKGQKNKVLSEVEETSDTVEEKDFGRV